jgi:hypothetical protein
MRLACYAVIGLLLVGCSGSVEGPETSSTENRSVDPSSANTANHNSGSAGSAGSNSSEPVSGIPCAYLHGRASLTSYENDNYASSSFSFEFASQDATLTHNEFDVVYEVDMFGVNLVTDDRSFIVDLGDSALRDLPSTVDPNDYPVGNWGKHDWVQAQVDHTYFVRAIDDAGRLVAAFRVIGLQPGVRVTIEWIRSANPDAMQVPTQCGL